MVIPPYPPTAGISSPVILQIDGFSSCIGLRRLQNLMKLLIHDIYSSDGNMMDSFVSSAFQHLASCSFELDL